MDQTKDTTTHAAIANPHAHDPEAGPITKNSRDSSAHDDTASTVNTGTAQRPTLAAPPTLSRDGNPSGRSACLTLLTVLLFAAYFGACIICVVTYRVIAFAYNTGRSGNDFLVAAAVLVGAGGLLVAGMTYAYAVWLKGKKKRAPAFMRYTLFTAPLLAHGVFIVLPLTVIAFKVVATEQRAVS